MHDSPPCLAGLARRLPYFSPTSEMAITRVAEFRVTRQDKTVSLRCFPNTAPWKSPSASPAAISFFCVTARLLSGNVQAEQKIDREIPRGVVLE
ncbi:MAG: hypothetical protein V3T70_04875, partial [Phycisphaerae bacterium]